MMTDPSVGGRILVVDDDAASRYLVETLLTASGYEVTSAADGREALDKARSERVDLLITDILMPRMDGYRLAREWKADPVLSAVPIMFYTATYTDPADEHLANEIGADRFVTKPKEPDELLGIVGELLKTSPAAASAPREASPAKEREVLREYSERLVHKLEEKIVEVKAVNGELRKTLEVLSDEVGVKNSLIDSLNKDIAERVNAEEGLRRAHASLDAVIESSPLPIVALDRDKNVTTWNAAAERDFGWTREDVLGRPNPAVPPEARNEQQRLLSRIWGGGRVDGYEVRRVAKDGRPIDVALFCSAVGDSGGEAVAAVAIFQDVTERRRIEVLKSDFISNVSHELRTPLTGIIGFSELMRERVDDAEACDALAEKIHEKAEDLKLLIEQLLEAASIQAGSTRISLQQAGVDELVHGIADGVTPPEGIEFRVEVEAGLPPVFIDRQRLPQALEPLLGNAFKYSPNGGSVVLSARREDGRLLIAISDEGVGIPAEELPHIFERFTQADMSTTRRFGGFGLGLYMAKRLVEAHGGDIRMESMPGHGSTVTIDLPLSDA
jgi:PAS domain S-box-containing protein